MINMFSFVRKYARVWAVFFLVLFAGDLSVVLALPHGPTTPEMGSFSPVEAGDYVNKFTGDFSYNLPLFEIGGYPINLSYNSNVSMDSEASWVGLGWSLNPGSVSRSMRGIPDDFSKENDFVTQKDRMKTNDRYSLGLSAKFALEIVGIKILPGLPLSLDTRLDVFKSTYGGLGFNFGSGISFAPSPVPFMKSVSVSGRLGFSYGSENGISVSPSLGVSMNYETEIKGNKATLGAQSSISTTYNSRTGVSEMSITPISLDATYVKTRPDKKDIKISGGLSTGSRFTIGNRSYIPNSDLPVSTLSYSGMFGLGPEAWFVNIPFSVSGSYTSQRLGGRTGSPVLTRRFKTYGYMNYFEDNDYNQSNAIYDFNRENDVPLDDKAEAFHQGFATYDMFNVSAQGLSGAYRAYRASPITVVSNGKVDINGGGSGNSIEGGNIGIEIGAFNLFKASVNAGIQLSNGHSGGWDSKSDLKIANLGTVPSKSNSLYKPIAFKQIGALSVLDEANYDATFGEEPIMMPLKKNGRSLQSLVWTYYNDIKNRISLLGEFKNKAGNTKTIKPNYRSNNRAPQSQPFNYYTAAEVNTIECPQGGTICNKQVYFDENSNAIALDRINDYRKSNHISRVDVIKGDGTKYQFGIPAYNIKHKESSFNVASGNQYVWGSPLCLYALDGNLPRGNGMTDFLNEKEYSPYAHSYLLTEVLSSDYYDISGNGPTKDDIGNYVKFNYVNWFSKSDPFKWKSPAAWEEMDRNPNNIHQFANYNEGKASKNGGEASGLAKIGDDIGSYTYGEKEIWYTKRMESKDKIAIFHLSENESPFARSLSAEHGQYIDKYQGKLDSISIYTRYEYEQNGANAIPEQRVHFRYDYSLCKLANYGKGKLTLKRVFTTYRDSRKSALTGYEFNYENNAPYSSFKRDGWGYYQNAISGNVPAPDMKQDIETRPTSYNEYPFKHQSSKPVADDHASKWLLSDINLPTGGSLHVTYESDDYGYVQNKNAGRTFQIAGFSNSPTGTRSQYIYSNNGNTSNNYVFVDITNFDGVFTSQGKAAPLTVDQYWDEAVRGVNDVPLRVMLDITNDRDYEFTTLYAKIDHGNHGVITVGNTSFGYLKLQEQGYSRNEGRNKINPIGKHGLQIARHDFYQKILTGNLNPSGPEKILKSLIGFTSEIKSMIKGQEKALVMRGFGSKVQLNKSLMVLKEPWRRKFGGGSRVKKIEMHDNWDAMTNNNHQEGITGWEYTYTKKEVVQGKEIEVSSGVAEWEPDVLSLENRNLVPIHVDENVLMGPDNTYYQLTPYSRTVFPSPGVGYSRVEETLIRPETPNGDRVLPIGKSISEFYTAREFPVRSDYTTKQLEVAPRQNKPSFSLVGNKSGELGVASQGFVVVLNDMHGKPKSEEHFRNIQTAPYRTVKYMYKVKGGLTNQQDVNPPFELDNSVELVSDKGLFYQGKLGVESEITVDTKEYFRLTRNLHVNFNIDVSFVVFAPIAIPTMFSPFDAESTFGRAITLTKVISKYGLLEKVVTMEDGAETLNQNVAYDDETGSPILTKSINEFKDEVYSFNYPGHWMYDVFDSRSKREGIIFKNLTWNALGEITSSVFLYGKDRVKAGDMLMEVGSQRRVFQVFENDNVLKLAVKMKGNYNDGVPGSSGSGTFKVLAEGNKNMLAVNVGTVNSLVKPVSSQNRLLFTASKQILNASAQTYKQFGFDDGNCTCDPFYLHKDNDDNYINEGAVGCMLHYRWYPETSYVPSVQTSRKYNNSKTHQFQIRHDGVLSTFSPYWKLTGGDWVENSSWTFTEKTTMVNYSGNPQEVVNPLNQYGSFKFNHNQTLMKAKLFNARKDEGYIEDFETTSKEQCLDGNELDNEQLNPDKAHTGNGAFLIEKNDEKTIKGNVKEY